MERSMSEKILCVDDEANVLAAFRRNLRKAFDLETAQSPEEGLKAIAETGPYAVVVSDLKMPGMDGIQFLAKVREVAPDAVRVMLTGNADLEAAAAAVNEGHIFRFLTKPVETDTLARALRAAIEQHRLVTAERVLLANTLNGAVTVLTDVLSLVSPIAFSQTARLKRYVRHAAEALGLPNLWLYELAAMLSQIGCVVLPTEVLERIHAGQTPTEDERQMYESHPKVARQLLLKIPRLGPVAEMIARQHEPLQESDAETPVADLDPVVIGAEMLKVALDFDRLVARGTPPKAAVRRLRQLGGHCRCAILATLEDVDVALPDTQPESVSVRDLRIGMIFAQDVCANNEALLVARGQEVTMPVLERLRRFAKTIGIVEPIRVLVSHPGAPAQPVDAPVASEV